MTTQEMLQKFKEYQLKISSYALALQTMSFDSETIAPKNSGKYRNPRMAFLSGELFSIESSEDYYEVLNYLANAEDADSLIRKECQEILKSIRKQRNIPKDKVVAYSQLTMDSFDVWQQAYHNKDYASFEPYLKKVYEAVIDQLQYRDDYAQKSNYDLLLDDYEPGMSTKDYDAFFQLIKDNLIPLIKKITEKEQFRKDFLYRTYPIDVQEKTMRKIMEYMHFDFDSGLISTSLHPFTSSFSKYDNRITTKYLENKLDSSIFSVIHESGHATYNAQVSEDLSDTYFFNNMSSGMHESQSRMFEIYLGKNRAFWEANFPLLKEAYPEQLKDVSLDEFYLAVNAAEPSFIRTEADELTYPLHIVIRYEIEKALINGELSFDQLNEVWNDKYEEYLGIRPENDQQGILQDVHWSEGLIGYFPTYALGSAYSAQFLHAMRKDLNVEECLRNNEFTRIREWLKENIQKYGGYHLPKEQVKIATGEEFNPQYYINYLVDKYTKLYNL